MARRKKKLTKSEKLVIAIVSICIIDLQLSYILAFLGKEMGQELATAIVMNIVAVVLGYFLKAFSENKEKAKMKFKKQLEGIYDEEEEV